MTGFCGSRGGVAAVSFGVGRAGPLRRRRWLARLLVAGRRWPAAEPDEPRDGAGAAGEADRHARVGDADAAHDQRQRPTLRLLAVAARDQAAPGHATPRDTDRWRAVQPRIGPCRRSVARWFLSAKAGTAKSTSAAIRSSSSPVADTSRSRSCPSPKPDRRTIPFSSVEGRQRISRTASGEGFPGGGRSPINLRIVIRLDRRYHDRGHNEA